MHIAAQRGHGQFVRHLVEIGSANIWLLSDSNQTACDMAAVHRHTQTFRYLESLQVRLANDQRTATEKAKTKALKEFNKRLAARAKQEAKLTAKRKKLSTSSSVDSFTSRLRAFSEPADIDTSSNVHDSEPSSKTSKGKSSKGGIIRKESSPDVLMGQMSDLAPKVGPLREKFSLRPSQHSLATFGTSSVDTDTSAGKQQPPVSIGRVNKMAQAVERLKSLGGFGVGDDEALKRSLYSLPPDSDTDAKSTRSDGRGKNKKGRKPHASASSQSTGRLRHGISNPELFSPRSQSKPQQRQTSLDDPETTPSASHNGQEDEESTLATFLHMLDLDDYLMLLLDEHMDMDALMLCSDMDLKDLDIPLGPRRKIMASLRQRKSAITSPAPLQDSHV